MLLWVAFLELIVIVNAINQLDFMYLTTFPSFDLVDSARKEFQKTSNCTRNTRIPCHFWMSKRNKTDWNSSYISSPWILNTIALNHDWQFHILDDNDVKVFMNTYFNNTKILWAFDHINPKFMPAKIDIWRYATLWMYGGGYMDIDSNIYTPLREVF